MKITCFEDDGTVTIRFSDKPVVREVSEDWNTHISYAEDGAVVELVILDAFAPGSAPVEVCHAASH